MESIVQVGDGVIYNKTGLCLEYLWKTFDQMVNFNAEVYTVFTSHSGYPHFENGYGAGSILNQL